MTDSARGACGTCGAHGAEFALPLQINYEDTDAGGVVYYGNYAGYMERARNACLRALGFPPGRLRQRHSILFVVTDAAFRYRAPARLDDELEVTLEIRRLGRASVVFAQQARRADEVLVDAEIRLAVVNCATCKPGRMPAELADALRRWSSGGAVSAASAAASAAGSAAGSAGRAP